MGFKSGQDHKSLKIVRVGWCNLLRAHHNDKMSSTGGHVVALLCATLHNVVLFLNFDAPALGLNELLVHFVLLC